MQAWSVVSAPAKCGDPPLDGDALPSSLTVALDLTPGSPRGVVRPPARWGPNPPGLEVGFVSARVWRPDNLNGVTLTTE